MSYPRFATMGQYGDQEPYQDDDGAWIVEAAKAVVSWIAGLFGGSGYPKDLPPPLPYGVSQVAAMLAQFPAIARELRELIARQGHGPCSWPVRPIGTASCGGQPPDPSRYSALSDLAALALWYANGTGDDLSRNEDTMRQIITQGMGAFTTGTPPGSSDPDPLDILASTAASEGRAAAERLAAELAEGIYERIPDSWRQAIERGLTSYYAGQVGGGVQAAVPWILGAGLGLAVLRARRD